MSPNTENTSYASTIPVSANATGVDTAVTPGLVVSTMFANSIEATPPTPSELAALRNQAAEVAMLKAQMAEMTKMMALLLARVPGPSTPPAMEVHNAPLIVGGHNAFPVTTTQPVPQAEGTVAIGAPLIHPSLMANTSVIPVGMPAAPPACASSPTSEVTPHQVIGSMGGVYTYDTLGADPDAVFELPSVTLEKGKGLSMKEIDRLIDEKVKTLGNLDSRDALLDQLYMFPKIDKPPKFKVPEFVKYNGDSNPYHHLKAYCLKMGSYSYNDAFLMAYFHESLGGSAYNWYMQLDHTTIKSWRELMLIFMRHYQHNVRDAMTRSELSTHKMKSGETFRAYAQRWRQMAAEVQPPMTEKEMISEFIKLLLEPFYSYMLGAHMGEFSHLFEIGERVDSLTKSGRLATNQPPTKGGNHYEESLEAKEVNFISQSQGGSGSKANSSPDVRPLPRFDVSNLQMFQNLVKKGLMCPKPIKPLSAPFPPWYNADLKCEYHMGVPGHSINTCDAFRRHIWQLVDNNFLGAKDGSKTKDNPSA